MSNQIKTNVRLEGLDVARFIAFLGMVIVNFNTVMVSVGDEGGRFTGLSEMLQGRAAATFVVLAGIGLGLAHARGRWDQTLTITLKRALFLLLIGLVNLLIFSADIIHYYAFFFLLGVLFLRAPNWLLHSTIAALLVAFTALVIYLDYDAGWDWQTYTYSELWTQKGFIRNLVFNGWHPLVPWFGFFLFGIILSRLDLASRKVQWRLLVGGSAIFATVTLVSRLLVQAVLEVDAEAAILFSIEPIPPMPLYMIVGAGAASAIVGACLLLEARLRSLKVLHVLAAPGRQTLTLYVAHIVIGMGALEAMAMIGGQDTQAALLAALLFSVAATAYALLWGRYFGRGPLETFMRKVAG